MRIANTICISKEKAVHHYVDLTIKVFEENSKITPGFECQLRTSKSGVCLDQNSMFADRGEKLVGVRNLDLFADIINE